MTILVKVIADSLSIEGVRLTTFELEYPRIIHSEFMTHRMFSRNAASSRAIPVDSIISSLETNPYSPIAWTCNKPGMQGGEPLLGYKDAMATIAWDRGLSNAIATAKELRGLNVHKQYANRGLEPYSFIKVVVTATEYDNWFELREHPDAQPEIHELANLMRLSLHESSPEVLRPHEWHTPYVGHSRDQFGGMIYGQGLSLQDAQKVSVSCCAQVSYRKLDDSLDKALRIYDQLYHSKPVHGSPFEHVARPMDLTIGGFNKGQTHMDAKGDMWSANFKGFVQYRQSL